ncbi:hypothetical protein SVAN01_05432 [Stagonosporopsis vannaccii]|nr:hypothetical protein SVAN01_05432 [Stagonosporopsis vannaccii]
MALIQDRAFTALGFSKATSSAGVVSYHKDLPSAGTDTPILVLLHGYPNSAYLWRNLIPLLPQLPLFVPDLPGYGNSAPPPAHDKVSVGILILAALRELLSPASATADAQPVVLVGHDRGARVAHHLHLSSPWHSVRGFSITGLALLDIVPTASQWGIGGSAAAATGFFHWSFLANPEIAVPMILAYGGGRWARDMIGRWAGSNSAARERMESGDAGAVYEDFFSKASVVEATTRDYEAGATVDVEFEGRAVREGRAIAVPLLLVYSAGFLTKRATKPIVEVWGRPWSEGAHLITECPVGNGVGHFVPEESPEETAGALREWLETLG